MDDPGAIEVREATAHDAEALASLNRIVQDLHRNAMPDVYKATDLATLARVFRERFLDPSWHVWLAERADGTPLGYVATLVKPARESPFHRTPARVEVDQLAVHPNARRRGVGRRLMAVAEGWAEAQGCAGTVLTVIDFNEEALGFYEALGYHTASRRMTKDLEPRGGDLRHEL